MQPVDAKWKRRLVPGLMGMVCIACLAEHAGYNLLVLSMLAAAAVVGVFLMAVDLGEQARRLYKEPNRRQTVHCIAWLLVWLALEALLAKALFGRLFVVNMGGALFDALTPIGLLTAWVAHMSAPPREAASVEPTDKENPPNPRFAPNTSAWPIALTVLVALLLALLGTLVHHTTGRM